MTRLHATHSRAHGVYLAPEPPSDTATELVNLTLKGWAVTDAIRREQAIAEARQLVRLKRTN